MLKSIKELHGAALRASDGQIGKVDEILFDDEHWTVRYLVVDTGGWLQSRQVLIAPSALAGLDMHEHILHVTITRAQVEASPTIDTNEPVSRQWMTDYHSYYGWPYYWGGVGLTGTVFFPGPLFSSSAGDPKRSQQAADGRSRAQLSERRQGDVHLHSTKDVTGYKVAAQDGHLGHIDDFIVDDRAWMISYLAVATSDWLPGKKVLLPPARIACTSWPDCTVTVGLTVDQLRGCPEWDPNQTISAALAEELSQYYAQLPVENADSPRDAAKSLVGR